MRKRLLILGTIGLLSTSLYAQTTVFSEDFATQQSQQPGWTVLDQDADGNNWGFYDFGANPSQTLDPNLNAALNAQGRLAISSSWSGSALTPDNYLISPAIDLSTIPTTANSVSLSFKVGSSQSASIFIAEYISVYVVSDISSATAISSNTPVHSAVLSQVGVSTYTYDISALAGQTVYLVFRHHNCTDQGDLLLDDISVVKAAGVGIEENVSVDASYPNPANNLYTIELEDGINTISVYGLDGKVLFTKEVKEKSVTIDVSDFPAGIYHYSIESSSNKLVRGRFEKY